jgi:hypothetical protein
MNNEETRNSRQLLKDQTISQISKKKKNHERNPHRHHHRIRRKLKVCIPLPFPFHYQPHPTKLTFRPSSKNPHPTSHIPPQTPKSPESHSGIIKITVVSNFPKKVFFLTMPRENNQIPGRNIISLPSPQIPLQFPQKRELEEHLPLITSIPFNQKTSHAVGTLAYLGK